MAPDTMGSSYSPAMGIIYVFNLIVGTGALTLPKAMASAGWLLSVVLLCVLGIMSFITTTFMVESLAIANSCKKKNNDIVNDITDEYFSSESNESLNHSSSFRPEQNENSPLLTTRFNHSTRNRSLSLTNHNFKITQAVEMGEMADMFFNKIGRALFYICIIIYLYGDLAIYAAAVPKSLRDIVCGNLTCDSANSSTPSDNDICWGESVTRKDVYYVFLAMFTVLLGPFTYFDVQKTKYLQIITTLFRWMAFLLMIVLAIIYISSTNGGDGNPPVANISGVPNLFGVAVYSFMCQHSLPSLVTPIKNKAKLNNLLAADYFLIFMFYLLLGMTAIYCFKTSVLKDLYTLNFQDSCQVTDIFVFRYFLGLFPVFTLSTNFPIIAVTLRNNLKALFKKTSSFYINRLLFPTLAILPPIAIAFGTDNLTTLVGITGSYAGAGVQYIIPAFLVLLARKEAISIYGRNSIVRNPHRSPFSRRLWVMGVIVWAAICLIFVTFNHILSLTGH